MHAEAEDDGARFPVQSDGTLRRTGVLRARRGAAKQHDILVVHDLAYADIVFDGWKAPSIMQVPGARDVAVEFFTMSKSYNMAAWRVGYMVGNKELVSRWRASRAITTTAPSRRSRWLDHCPGRRPELCRGDPAMYQNAATCWPRAARSRLDGRGAESLDVHLGEDPEAYASMGSLEFAKLLAEARVAVSPGCRFR